MQQLGKGAEVASIPLPDPRICNLHLAVARVFSASGFAEVVERFYKENGDSGSETANLGDDLSCKLTQLLFVQNLNQC